MNTTRFRRTTTGTCLVVWPLSMLGAALAQPEIGEHPAEVYDAAANHAGRIAASVAIGGPGVLLWVVAVVGVVHLIRSRGATLAQVGGGLALLGALGHAVMATLFLVLLGLPQDGHRTELLPVLDRVAGHVFPVALPLLMLGGVGVVLLAFALRRAGRAPLATPWLVSAGFVSEMVPLGGTTGDIVLWALVGAGLGLAGLRVLGLSDEQWDAPSSAAPSVVPAAT
jgi:hypothetical protein